MRGVVSLLFCGVVGIAKGQSVPNVEIGSANLPAQTIGANDLIAVSVYDQPEFTRSIRVSSDGFIRLPMLERRIIADGLLPADLETSIAEALRSENILVDPIVTVTIAEYHSRPISVAGAVKNPITFQAAAVNFLTSPAALVRCVAWLRKTRKNRQSSAHKAASP